MFDEIDLLTRTGEFVVRVRTLPFQIRPEAICWGDRFFVRRDDEKYYEGFVAVAMGEVTRVQPPSQATGEPQTCPRRAEGPGYGVEGADRWELKNWKFTDPEEAKKANDAEAQRKNAEAKSKGQSVVFSSNPRYWLWPGPGPTPRTCSYCGCIHPEDVLRLKREFKFEVTRSTKSYKVYIEAPGYGIEQVNSLANMQAGVDPVEAFSKNKVQAIYPPLKAYSPHFSPDQWSELLR